MKLSVSSRMLVSLAPIVLVLAVSGCATKKYVGKKIDVVDHRLNQLQAQTNDRWGKQQTEISQLHERVTTTDNRLSAVDNAAQQANTTAGQALQQAQTNASAIQSNTSDISAHSAELVRLGNQFNYSLVESSNVTFGFDNWQLTKDAKDALDLMIQKAKATPRARIELLGYTDEIGPQSYNLTLSRRRAEAVARYLVKNDISPMSISVIGLGEEQTPSLLAAEVENFNPNANKQQIRALARRVRIKLYTPGTSSPTATAATEGSGQGQN